MEPSILTLIDQEIDKRLAFQEVKLGDTPTDANQLTPKKYVDTITSVINSSIVSLRAQIPSVIAFQGFGDGSDGTASIIGTSILGRDMYYQNLTILNGGTLQPAGYQIFVASVLTINSGGIISYNGFNGGNGVTPPGGGGGAGGGGGSILAGGTLASVLGGGNGGAGGHTVTNSGGQSGFAGSNGGQPTHSIGVNGASSSDNSTKKGGVAGANQGGAGGNSVVGATITPASNLPHTLTGMMIHADLTDDFYPHQGSAGTPGGGGGGGGADNSGGNAGSGGGGGGGGGNGGIIAIYANAFINSATPGVQAKGGSGGNGGNGSNANAGNSAGGGGGGAGGTGGTGGVVLIMYHSSVQTGTIDVSGGSGGTFGTGGTRGGVNDTNGDNGVAGNSGATGNTWLFQV